jgi:hypothetical protein
VRLGFAERPLGPPDDPGIVQAAEVYEAILTGQPYPVKAMVLFGSDPFFVNHALRVRVRAHSSAGIILTPGFSGHSLFNFICPTLTHFHTIAYTHPTLTRKLNTHTPHGSV